MEIIIPQNTIITPSSISDYNSSIPHLTGGGGNASTLSSENEQLINGTEEEKNNPYRDKTVSKNIDVSCHMLYLNSPSLTISFSNFSFSYTGTNTDIRVIASSTSIVQMYFVFNSDTDEYGYHTMYLGYYGTAYNTLDDGTRYYKMNACKVTITKASGDQYLFSSTTMVDGYPNYTITDIEMTNYLKFDNKNASYYTSLLEEDPSVSSMSIGLFIGASY